ncbi:MAG: hypothetical protein IPK68_10015 [Bdellovibrionales bacterium]|nr:hypothetical protein [Bdellovibrionales bacterium]
MKPVKWIVGLPRSGKTDHILAQCKRPPTLICENVSRKLSIHLKEIGFLGERLSWREAIARLKDKKSLGSVWIVMPELPYASWNGLLNEFIQIVGVAQAAEEVWVESDINGTKELAETTRTMDKLCMQRGYRIRPLILERHSNLEIQFDPSEMWSRIDDLFNFFPQFPILHDGATNDRILHG